VVRKAGGKEASSSKNGANLGFETKLWAAADKLRNNMDAAEYKHVVLGLIFLKYISDAFEERHFKLDHDLSDPASQWYIREPQARYLALEDPDEYRMENIFWVPKEARWSGLQGNAKQPTIGKLIDDAMVAIERDNPTLKGVLPKDYNRQALDKQRLGELIDLIGTIGLGDKENRSKDILGRVYEYFLSQFASAEGKKGGQFYTPRCVVKILVEMIEPYKGRVYDPCCGSGGMFVSSEKFVEAHGGNIGDISIYGQESNPTTWKLAKMNLAIRGIEGNLGPDNGDSFHRDHHPDLKADFILANPPFNMKDWGGERLREDIRWKYSIPPNGNANFAWVQHFIHHLSPTGIAGFVLANGSMSSNQSGEGEIRKNIIEADLVDCMIALPGHLFYSTYNQVGLWFITRDKTNKRFRNRKGQTLFIDARNLGGMVDRTHRELSDVDIAKISKCYHSWRDNSVSNDYRDIPGLCKSATTDEIRKKGYILTPARYTGSENNNTEKISVPDCLSQLTQLFIHLVEQSRKSDEQIIRNLDNLGFNMGKISIDSDNLEREFPEIHQRELNLRMNETLTAMMTLLFKSWFVDFDCVHAKERGESSDLPAVIENLMPGSFEDTPLGEIPSGWRVGIYEDVLLPSNEKIRDEVAPEYSATVTGLDLREQRFNKQLAKSRRSNKKIIKNDLVFGLSRRVVNFGLMKDIKGSVSPVYEVFHVKTDVYVPELLEMYIRYNMSAHMDILKPGAREGQPIDREYLLSKELVIPDIKIQKIFQQIFSGFIPSDFQK
jgi:type I restriction enzyme M protein